MDYIDKLALVEIKNRKALQAKSFGKDKWFTPGGKRMAGETDQQALIREIKEELGVDLLPESIAYYGTFEARAHGKPEGTIVRLTCYTASFEGLPKPCSEIEEVTYFDYSQKNLASLAGQLVLENLKQKYLID